MATIKDVAELASVSISTVSRTLSGKIFVEEETRKRVLEAVKELDYKPNMLAQGLKGGKTSVIALIVPDINSLYYSMLLDKVEEYASKKGYTIFLSSSKMNTELEEENLSRLKNHMVDGIICLTVNKDVEHLKRFQDDTGIPIMLLNRYGKDKLSSVSIDHFHGSYTSVKYLLDHGHKNIVGLFGNREHGGVEKRIAGFKAAFEEAGLPVKESSIITDITSMAKARTAVVSSMQGDKDITAFFASEDMMSLGIYSGVSKLSLHIPQDISVICFDDIYTADHMVPPLTTYDCMVPELAEKAVKYMVSMIDNKSKKIHGQVMKGKVIPRASVRNISI